VIPADIRASSNLAEGTDLVVVDSGCGIVLLTPEQLRDRSVATWQAWTW